MNLKTLRNSLLAIVAVMGIAAISYAATKGDASPAMKYGAVNILNSAATAVPDMAFANAVMIQNLGPNVIYCGSNSSVTSTTGVQVAASGGVLTIDIVQSPPVSGSTTVTPSLYCIAATADQTSPNNTRYIRVR